MNPVTSRPRHRRLPRALLAGVLAWAIALLGVVLVAPAQATARPPGGAAEPDDVFSARIERVERDPGPVGRPTRYTYTVQVQQVFGESDITSVRVRVQTTSSYGECSTRPDAKGSDLYLWKLTRQGDRLLASGCRSVLKATDARLAEAEAEFGEPRSPIDTSPGEPQVEFPEVSYTCPATEEAISDVAGAEGTCSEVAAPQSFDRAAAPGLALVIVGLLGWIVVLRLGRTRRS
ncbi:MAG: hypothetical protein CMJ44_04080 [Pimelobacter sp.]|nr:hypothetical protein [Pimelobacter sp.]